MFLFVKGTRFSFSQIEPRNSRSAGRREMVSYRRKDANTFPWRVLGRYGKASFLQLHQPLLFDGGFGEDAVEIFHLGEQLLVERVHGEMVTNGLVNVQ